MRYFKIICFLSCAFFCNFLSQSTLAQHGDGTTDLFVEKLSVVTDRDVYCVNEVIRFKAFNCSGNPLRNADWSNVLYVEIVDQYGTALVQQKFNYNDKGASGILFVPRKILTGNYFLRAYTRWMRNYPAEKFFYKALSIVNPFDELVEQNSLAEKVNTNFSVQHSKMPVTITLDKKQYGKREKVNVSLSALNQYSNCVMAVVKKEFYQPRIIRMLPLSSAPESGFIPETRSLSLTGKVVSINDSVSLPFHQVFLTIMKDQPEMRSALSTENGSVYFNLPELRGEYELLISAGTGLKNEKAIVLVDNDFSTQKINLPALPLMPDSADRSILQKLSFNSQIQYLYNSQPIRSMKEENVTRGKFYGEPNQLIELDDYINLPTLDDYFRELVTLVSVRKVNGQKILRVQGQNPELRNNEPLVLIDMISVNNINDILNIPPDKIKSIEIINQPYVYGNFTYGGVISLISKGGKFADINLGGSSHFVDYKMFNSSVSELEDQYEKRIPDLRSSLYWKPDFSLAPEEENLFTFHTGDVAGEFIIVITGTNDKNQLETSIEYFTVVD
ncbi:TonB-dependent receptor [Draconibacterium sp.]|uniref:TonB-dependent receptor n=1 Tax=Draconibacterium sp. TaxID=1965318 RepID=UPI00356843ED